jgi:hypothetical protein
MEVVPDSITSESQEPEEVVTPTLLELAPDSEMEVVLDSIMRGLEDGARTRLGDGGGVGFLAVALFSLRSLSSRP